MKTKTTSIKIALPTEAEIVAELDLETVHPPLVKARAKLAEAERALADLRDQLGAAEREVSELPSRVQRGEVAADRLATRMRERDALALRLPAAQQVAADAKQRAEAEEQAAAKARDGEILKRREVLEKAVEPLRPVLEELRELEFKLAKAGNPLARGLALDWPCASTCG